MRRFIAVFMLCLGLIGAALASPASASVSKSDDYLSLASRSYPVTTTSVAHTDIPAGTGKGYWMVASDGGVFAFGDAKFAGSAAGITSHAIIGMAKTKTGQGYWLAASDGGIFAFGDAKFYGSVPGLSPSAQGQHVFSSFAPAADGNGYYLLDRNGNVYAFGSAKWYGSPAGTTQGRTVTALAPTPTGNGYYMMDIRGSLWGYGDAAAGDVRNALDYAAEPWSKTGRVQLSAVSQLNVYAMSLNGVVTPGFYNEGGPSYGSTTNADYPMTGFATTAAGYYETAMDGSVFTHGDAKFYGSLPQFVSATNLVAPIVGMAISGPTPG